MQIEEGVIPLSLWLWRITPSSICMILHIVSYTKAEFNNGFIIYSKYFQRYKKDKTFLSSVTNCKVDNIQQFSLQILINHAKLENK